MKYGLRLSTWALAASALPCVAQLPLDVYVEYATFKYDDAESIVELYLSIGAASLRFSAQDEQYLAQVPTVLSLWRASDAALEGTPGDAVWQHSTMLEFMTADTLAIAEGQYYVRQMRITVPPGEYELRVASVAASGQEVEVRRDIIVPTYDTADGCVISDITLATSITRSDDRSDPFFKNGLVIEPNANRLYGESMSRLWYYAEAYESACAASPDDGQYTLLAFVSQAGASTQIGGLQKRSQRRARPVDVLAGSFPLNTLPSGSYFLRLVLLNAANEAQAEQSRKFFVFNPSVAVTQQEAPVAQTFETSEYASMPEDELSKGLEHIRVIATESELQRLSRIEDLDEQRRFLMNFWRVRDPEPNTPTNEFREEFYTLLGYANERYSTRSEEGWRSDRGRVLIKYGQPSSIEPRLYDVDTKPHEIWAYNSIAGEGQAHFVFADLNGFGIFELIHSTVSGERKLAGWETELKSTRY